MKKIIILIFIFFWFINIWNAVDLWVYTATNWDYIDIKVDKVELYVDWIYKNSLFYGWWYTNIDIEYINMSTISGWNFYYSIYSWKVYKWYVANWWTSYQYMSSYSNFARTNNWYGFITSDGSVIEYYWGGLYTSSSSYVLYNYVTDVSMVVMNGAIIETSNLTCEIVPINFPYNSSLTPLNDVIDSYYDTDSKIFLSEWGNWWSQLSLTNFEDTSIVYWTGFIDLNFWSFESLFTWNPVLRVDSYYIDYFYISWTWTSVIATWYDDYWVWFLLSNDVIYWEYYNFETSYKTLTFEFDKDFWWTNDISFDFWVSQFQFLDTEVCVSSETGITTVWGVEYDWEIEDFWIKDNIYLSWSLVDYSAFDFWDFFPDVYSDFVETKINSVVKNESFLEILWFFTNESLPEYDTSVWYVSIDLVFPTINNNLTFWLKHFTADVEFLNDRLNMVDFERNSLVVYAISFFLSIMYITVKLIVIFSLLIPFYLILSLVEKLWKIFDVKIWSSWNLISLPLYVVYIITMFSIFAWFLGFISYFFDFIIIIFNYISVMFIWLVWSVWDYDFFRGLVILFYASLSVLFSVFITYRITTKFWRAN